MNAKARWALVLVVGVAPLAIGGAVWALKRQRDQRLHPGNVEVVLVDAYGKPWTRATTVRLGKQTLRSTTGTVGPFAVDLGEVAFFAHPTRSWGCGTSQLEASRRPFTGGDFTVSVGGAPTDELQHLEVRLGAELDELLRQRETTELRVRQGTREVSVEVVFPDGGPASGANVRCPNNTVAHADRAGVATCGAFFGERDVSAGIEGLGGVVTVHATDDEASVVVDRPGFALDVEVRGLADAGHITLNSKETRSMVFSDSAFFEQPFVPLARTIVCSRDDAPQACEIVVPDGGVRHSIVLEVGPPGTLEFEPVVAGRAVREPILYVDRALYPAKPGEKQSLLLSRGRHVLVINVDGPERYETVFEIESGRTTSLGVVTLAPP